MAATTGTQAKGSWAQRCRARWSPATSFDRPVVKTDGSSLDYVGAILRFIGLILSFFVVLIGVIWVAFDAEKGWHDKIAGTYVLKTA